MQLLAFPLLRRRTRRQRGSQVLVRPLRMQLLQRGSLQLKRGATAALQNAVLKQEPVRDLLPRALPRPLQALASFRMAPKQQ